MPDQIQYSIQDRNRIPGQMIHSGTSNAATLIRQTGQADGAANSYITGGTLAITDVETTAFEGGTVAVGTAAVEMTFTGLTQAIQITADHDNTAAIYIGGTGVTFSGAGAVTRLAAGQTVSFDLNDGTAPVYAVAGTTSQKVYKFALI